MSLVLLLMVLVVREAAPQTDSLQGVAQGTTYHIKFVRPTRDFASKDLEADIEKKLAEIDREMSTYRSDSEISRFNRAPAGEWFPVSRAVAEVVAASREISEKSGGAQDITVGPLVNLWRFGPKDSASGGKKVEFTPPSDAAVQADRKRVGYTKLDVRLELPRDGSRLRGSRSICRRSLPATRLIGWGRSCAIMA